MVLEKNQWKASVETASWAGIVFPTAATWLVNLVVVVSSLMRLTSRAWHALKDGFSPRTKQIRQTFVWLVLQAGTMTS